MPDLRIGIDVGGTNTDAVALDEHDKVIAKAKRPTTPDVTAGIRAVLDAIDVPPRDVTRVMLGTTHATNAILERRNLGRVAVIRLGAPATTSVPPLSDWPDDLRRTVSAGEVILPGGFFVDGRPISPLDPDAIKRFVGGVQADAVAITGVFSPASTEQELEVAELVRAECGLPVSLSHEIGSLGLLERENATVLNASLYGVAAQVVEALVTAIRERGISAQPYLAQNDGTLMTVEQAARLPVATIGSGPANSLRGAAFLSGIQDAIVVDVGGTSTDLGVLTGGFPRESAAAVEIGGVLTNFRMPDILSIALGGGTIVRGTTLGPDSVGYRITEKALVFGGDTLTLTDVAVAAGRSPDSSWRVNANIDALAVADTMIADAVDRMALGRTRPELVVVGGGAFLVKGASPEHAEVANAVGAAIALASGRVDTILPAGESRSKAIERAKEEAAAKAVAAGADPSLVEIVEVHEVPMAYLSEPAVRLNVKAAGPLARH